MPPMYHHRGGQAIVPKTENDRLAGLEVCNSGGITPAATQGSGYESFRHEHHPSESTLAALRYMGDDYAFVRRVQARFSRRVHT